MRETASRTEQDTAQVGERETEEQDNTKEKQKNLKNKIKFDCFKDHPGWKDLGLPGLSCAEEVCFKDARKA